MREKVALGELCNPSLGQVKEQPDTLIDYIDISSVDNESKCITGFQTMSFAEAPSRARKNIKKNNILVSTVRPNLNAVAVCEEETPNKTVASTGFCVLDCKDNVDYRFVFNFCKSQAFIGDMVSQATGASYPAVSDKIVRSSMIPVYSYEEQCQISCILDTASKIIADRKKELQKLDELIKARFVEMFEKFIKGENSVGFESICEFVTVGIANSATHAFCDDGVIMFRNQNIKEDYLDTSDVVHITPEFASKYKTKMLKKDDLLIVRTGYPGVACLVPEQYEGCQTFTTLIARLKDTDIINPRFVCHYINSEYGKKYVEENSAGAAQQNFGATALSKLPICIPPIELQNEYISFVHQVDKSKSVVQKALEESQLLFDSLMQKYFA